jgi:hypothetical protein
MNEEALTYRYAMLTTGMAEAVDLLRLHQEHYAATVVLTEVDRRMKARASAFLAKAQRDSVTA